MEDEVEKVNNTQKMRVDGVKQSVPFYSLDVIISVGYRVKSKRGVEFRRTKRLGWRFLRKKKRQKQACSENIISQTGFVYPTFCPTW